MANVAKQIIGSFEDIGKDVARETAKLPFEMLGMGKKSKSQTSPNSQQPLPAEASAKVGREWLAELAGKNKQHEPTVQERFEREKQEKQEKEVKKNMVEQKMAPLPKLTTKAKRGNLFGSQQSSEKSKNSRAD